MAQEDVIRCFEVLGEAATKISTELRTQNPDMGWVHIIAMRNTLIHNYQGVDLETVWSTIQNDLPLLKIQLEALLSSMNDISTNAAPHI